jgi:hypothetical protein
VTGCRLDDSVCIPDRDFSFRHDGQNGCEIQRNYCVSGALPLEIKRPEREADY